MKNSAVKQKTLTPEEKKARNIKIWSAVFLLGANMLLFLTIWLSNTYDDICIDQFLYHLKSSTVGSDSSLTGSAVLVIGVCSFLVTGLEIWLYILLSGGLGKLAAHKCYAKYCAGKVCRFFHRRVLPLALALFLASGVTFLARMEVLAYIAATFDQSDLIQELYADPSSVELKFPEKKRNLIYIFLESMESTYGSPEAGGLITDNFIPELTALAQENVSFSHREGLGGALNYAGTTWTAAALVSQTSGVTVKVPLTAVNYGGDNPYMPGLVTLGDILEEQGYQQSVLFGSDAEFANRDSYFTEHGNYNILDTKSLKEAGKLPEDYHVWWGFEDEKLMEYAKEEITRLASADAPFNFTMLTADSHFPDGYVCDDCEDIYEEQYANVLRCSSKRVYELVEWIKEQPFYENTTIVLCGDHLTMDPNFLDGIDEDYVRTIYNCFINAPVAPVTQTCRQYGSFDLFPTTLAAMGVEIKGDRLALGTNLFSAVPTLTEQYGYEYLAEELQKNSDFYNAEIIQ